MSTPQDLHKLASAVADVACLVDVALMLATDDNAECRLHVIVAQLRALSVQARETHRLADDQWMAAHRAAAEGGAA